MRPLAAPPGGKENLLRALVVEDDPKTSAYLTAALAENGFVADASANGEDALDRLRLCSYDAVVLDVMLPLVDGWSVLERIRRFDHHLPVLMLTARDSIPDRVRGLELGADDYLIKPFAFSELLARLRAILRRGTKRAPEHLQIADLQVDLFGHKASRSAKRLDLSPKEFALLALLARRSGEVLSRTLIVEKVWDLNFDCETNVVDVHIRRLRAKVDDPFEHKLIHTVRGVGYVLEPRE